MARILVVEDNQDVSNLLAWILSLEGYQVEEVSSAAAAIEVVRSAPPDLVITDLLMPDRDGLELIRDIRRSGAVIPIIAVSAGGRIGPATYLEIAEKLGADRVFAKPFLPESILRAVGELLA